MQLKFIPHENCPTCGSGTVSESCRDTHCNGQGFEERTFACGATVEWVPNFERLRVKIPCLLDPSEIEIKKKRKNLIDAIYDIVEKSDVSDFLKKQIRQHLSWL